MMDTLAPISRVLHKVAQVAQDHAPEILTALGIAGGVTAGVIAVKATPKMEPALDELEKGLANIDEAVQLEAYEDPADARKDRVYVWVKTGKQFVKVYGPSIALGTVSIAAILYGHGLLKKRNALLIAAYQTLERSFAEYRQRVIADQGPAKDQEYLTATKLVENTNEQGESTKTEVIESSHGGHPYRFHWSKETSTHWRIEPELNYYFLMARQNYWNDKLRFRGQVFLNEVLDDLGFDQTDTGAITGWTWQGEGDNMIDFGFEPAASAQMQMFLDGQIPDTVLDFNVDGVIIGKGLLNKKHLSR